MNEPKNKAAAELGRKGGKRTKELYGKNHFSKAGKIGAAKRWGKDSSTDEDDNGLTE